MPLVLKGYVAINSGGDGFRIESVGSQEAAILENCFASGSLGQGFNLVSRGIDIHAVRAFLDINRETLSDAQLERAVEMARSAPGPETYHSLIEFLNFLGLVETASGVAEKLLNLIWS